MVCIVVTVRSILRTVLMKFAFIVIRMKAERNLIPTLDQTLFRTACNIISRPNDVAVHPTPCLDDNLRGSLVRFQTCLPAIFVFPHRAGLSQALVYASQMWVANTGVDVVEHLEDRMRRWMVVWLGRRVAQHGVTEARLWRIARRLVSRLVWNERQAAAVARAAGNPSPAVPAFQPPASIHELLTEELLYEQPPLNFATREAVWSVFEETLQSIGGPLPLCPTNYGRGRRGARGGT
jgi:hypothetical protein